MRDCPHHVGGGDHTDQLALVENEYAVDAVLEHVAGGIPYVRLGWKAVNPPRHHSRNGAIVQYGGRGRFVGRLLSHDGLWLRLRLGHGGLATPTTSRTRGADKS